MGIGKDKVVSINYTLRDDDGKVIDTSEGREPLAYLHGARNIVPGLEAALEGKNIGDQVHVAVEPAGGYGDRDDRMVQTVPRAAFGENKVETGMQFQAQTPAGARVVTVVDVQGDEVTVDGNHPLAGRTLNFDVTIVEVRDATPEEREHGHVHGPGGHHH